MIKLENVHKVYEDGSLKVHALRDICLQVYRGEFVTIMLRWDGQKWEWFAGAPPFDQIEQYRMRPNGVNSGPEHWVIRRWVSRVSGRISIDWRLFKEAVTGSDGNGVTLRIFQNGVQRDSAVISGEDTAGVIRTLVLANLQVGDKIEAQSNPAGHATYIKKASGG